MILESSQNNPTMYQDATTQFAQKKNESSFRIEVWLLSGSTHSIRVEDYIVNANHFVGKLMNPWNSNFSCKFSTFLSKAANNLNNEARYVTSICQSNFHQPLNSNCPNQATNKLHHRSNGSFPPIWKIQSTYPVINADLTANKLKPITYSNYLWILMRKITVHYRFSFFTSRAAYWLLTRTMSGALSMQRWAATDWRSCVLFR